MKVLLATPAYGGQVTEAYFQSVLSLLHAAYARGVQVDVMTLANESLITRARNEVVATFLGGDWTHLFFVDADISFTPEHFFRLLDSGKPLTATPYAMKGLNWSRMAETTGGADELRAASVFSVVNAPSPQRIEDGFLLSLDAGTGFMCIERSVLERLVENHPETSYTSDSARGGNGQRWALFDCGIVDGRYLSEDYMFCRRWQTLGGELWVDVHSPNLGHQGSYTFGK